MNRKIILFSAAICLASAAYAQTFERGLRRNFWNDGVNVAGIRCDSITLSNAELGASYEAGNFRNFSDPETRFDIGAGARTVTHLKGLSFIGSFSFNHSSWRNACGSMLMDAQSYPFDIYEFTPGGKTFQTYTMKGGFSKDLSGSWRIGAGLSFKAENAAKTKDLRYTAYLLDLEVVPSVQYLGENFTLGASVIYRRKTQSVSAEQVGSTTTAPYVFFDEGALVGSYQEWTGSSVHLQESGVGGFPTASDALGVGIQASVWELYADVEFLTLGASAGEKQIFWYRYRGPQLAAHLGWRHGANAVRAAFDWKKTTNNKTVYDKKTVGGVTNTYEYGANTILNRSNLTGSLEYEFLGRNWEARARVSASDDRKLVTNLYPYVNTAELTEAGAEMEGVWHLWRFDLTLDAMYAYGKYSEANRSVASDSGVSTIATTLRRTDRTSYNTIVNYINAPKYGGALKIRYNFPFRMYLEASGKLLVSRWGTSFKIGYNF